MSAEWIGWAALVLAALHLILASRRDLGALPVGGAAAATSLAALGPEPRAVGLAVGALIVAALGWSRAARHGVGRPAITGWVLAVGGLGAASCWLAPQLIPGLPLERIAPGVAGLLALSALVGAGLALERPGPRGSVRPRRRRVPIEDAEASRVAP